MNLNPLDYRRLLQGGYEADRLPKDFPREQITPDFALNVLNDLGLLYRPVVDEDYLARGGQRPVWPEGKPFAVCLTHDVDLVSLHSFHQTKRMRSWQVMNARPLAASVHGFAGFWLDVLRAMRHGRARDPLHCFERWLEIEAQVNARSTFFFWPGWKAISHHHCTDCLYNMEDRIVFDGQRCTVAEMIRVINRRGWEIGLHPSWYSFDDAEEMKRQKEALEKNLGHDVVSVRQHLLHYDIRVTPRVQAEAGFKYDSTLGFNDNVGFRFGTCYPWRLYDLKDERELSIVEVPLIIQDGALLNPEKGMRLNADTAFAYVEQITEIMESVGGVLTLLWHPHAVINPPWWNLYCRTLKYLKEKNAWLGSVRGVMDCLQNDATFRKTQT